MASKEQDHSSTERGCAKIVTREVDRISALPDSIILHILSQLPSMEGVIRTGVLSKRWQYLWTSVPTLTFSKGTIDPFNFRVAKKKHQRFVSFVSDTLTQCRHTKLKSFQLLLKFEQDFVTQLNLWIRYAVGAHVEEIDLSLIDHGQGFWLLQHVFTNAFLTNLKLMCCTVAPSGQINLKLLNKLSLCYMEPSDDVIRSVILGSPVLKFLKLGHCFGFCHLDINSSSVRRLVFDSYGDYKNKEFFNASVRISALYIVSLDIKGTLSLGNLVLDVPSLIEVSLNSGISCPVTANEKDLWKGLLQSLHHVRKLKVGNSTIKVLTRLQLEGYSSLPMCKCLKLNSLEKDGFPGLANVLQKSPNLESLSIIFKTDNAEVLKFPRPNYWACQNMEFQCLRKSVKTVEILYDVRWDEECELAQFILETANVLEKMIIVAGGKDDWWDFSKVSMLKVTRKLLSSLPRASKSAVLLFKGFPSR